MKNPQSDHPNFFVILWVLPPFQNAVDPFHQVILANTGHSLTRKLACPIQLYQRKGAI